VEQGEAFSRAVRGVGPLGHGVEDAIGQMRVLDPLLRSADLGRWEAV
jgi:predicted dehydrogenase